MGQRFGASAGLRCSDDDRMCRSSRGFRGATGWRVSLPHGHHLPAVVPRRLRIDGHRLVLTHPVLLCDEDPEHGKDRRTHRSRASRLPLPKLLAQSQRSHGHRCGLWRPGSPQTAVPGGQTHPGHHQATQAPALTPGLRGRTPGRPEREELTAVSSAPRGIPEGSPVPQRRGRRAGAALGISRIN